MVAALGLVLLGVAVVLGLLTGILFIFPSASILGAKAVNERDTQIVYRDSALADAFANGKLIIESYGTNVEVKMSNSGYEGQNTVVVNESATGIAFNSLSRTLIEWTQTLYNEELYYRIKILEPSGMVFSQTPTTVYINLPYRNDDFHYDFVLQNHYSPVNFSFVDETPSATDKFLIGNLVVESAASVNFPFNQNNSLNNVVVKGNKTKLVCKSPILNNVVINGADNVLEFGNSSLAGIGGNLTIHGDNNQINGTSAQQVRFDAKKGRLNMSQTIAALNVDTVNAEINVKTVTGAVIMKTKSGSLRATSVGNGLKFDAGIAAEPNATASVDVGKITGTAVVNNYGIGTIKLKDVDGDMTINSYQIGGGAIDVSCLNGAEAHQIKILGYDGDINVRNINGGNVEILVLGEQMRAGAANIHAHFNQIGTNTLISTGGYLSGPVEWGNVDVSVANDCNNFDMYVYYARSANSSAKFGYDKVNMYIIDEVKNIETPNHITVKSGNTGAVGTLKVRSQNKVHLS